MICSVCQRDNPSDNAFCGSCGTRLGPLAGALTSPAVSARSSHPSAFAEGRYKVERFLGEGSRKRVYLAHDARLDRDVTIAVIKSEGLDDAGRARVHREAQAMARLGDHPHIVNVFDIGEENGNTFIVSQFMAGGSVDDLLRQGSKAQGIEGASTDVGTRALPLDHSLRIADEVCQALAYAHSRGVIHRDLKPGNVWLAADGSAKLGDFGLAFSADSSRLTTEGIMLGTVAYMPPEQALGRAPDARSDLYSLGAMLYEMVTGRPPFLGDDTVAIISQHINTAPVAPSWHNPAVPPALEALILRLLAKVPEDRPANATAVREALAAITVALAAEAGPAARPPGTNPLDRLAGGIFVGRESAMQELRTGLDETLAGRGRLLLVVGEPGIGKTRTAEELATYARLRGTQVLIGRCYEGEGAPAYWPWVQVIRSYVHDLDLAALVAEMGSGAADIAQVVQEVRERLPDLPTPPPLDPDQARFRLFDSVTTFLQHAAQRQPLVLIIDDLHWADKPSLVLLQFLARELSNSRILVVATYRDVELRRHHPLSEALAELSRAHLSQRILLRGITAHDVARFIEMTAGKTPPESLVAAVYRETEGNPFFVSEMVRLLVADGRLERWDEPTSWSVSIPQSVREVVGKRLDRLSERANQVLTVAAVIGREFGLSVLERVSDLPNEALLESLEEAVSARIIAEVPRGPATGLRAGPSTMLRTGLGRYAFSHALIRETLYGELPTTRRVRLHRQIAQALERLHSANLDPHLAELAYHFFEAAPGGDVPRAIDYARRAAERATTLVAYEEAAVHYERALQAMELQEPADELERCELLLALGQAFRRAGDFARARDTFRRAAAVARTLVGPLGTERAAPLLARAALGFAEEGLELGTIDTVAIDLLEEALRLIGTVDDSLRALLLARLANQLYWTQSRERGVALSQQAIDIARRLGSPSVLARTIGATHLLTWSPQRVDALLGLGTEILQLAAAAGDTTMVLAAHEWRLMAYLQSGDIAEADREIADHERLSNELRLPLHRWLSLSWNAMRALLDGRFADAQRFTEQAWTIGQRLRPVGALQMFRVQMFVLQLQQGLADEVEIALRGFIDEYPQYPIWRCALAYLYAGANRLPEARAEFERLAARDFTDIPEDIVWLEAVTLLADVCAALGDTGRAPRLLELLQPYAGRTVVVGGALVCLGSVSRNLGLLATTLERWDEAEHYFDDALRMHVRMGARPFIALTQRDHAGMLLARDAPGDRERAITLANEALEHAHALGMKIVVEQAAALKVCAQGIASADFKTSIDAVASRVETQRPDLRQLVAPDGTVTLMFSDMEGFTEMTERLGDRDAHKVIQAHNAIVREQLAAHGGFELELQGDGFLLAFADPRRAVACAVAIQRVLAQYNTDHPEQPIRVRIGLHTGEAIQDADKFFGKTVILAARIAAQARGGEVLVSSALRELIDSDGGFRFNGNREVMLKGLAGTYALHSVDWASQPLPSVDSNHHPPRHREP